MRLWLSGIFLAWWVGSARGQPAELFATGDSLPACSEIEAGAASSPFECPGKKYTTFMGYVAWGPLRYVGPITIEVHALKLTSRIPLYIQFATTQGRPIERYCDGPSDVVMIVNGGACSDDPESIGPLDLEAWGFISRGDSYFIRAQFFTDPGVWIGSPYLGWIHVFPTPTAVEGKTWTLVKSLYR